MNDPRNFQGNKKIQITVTDTEVIVKAPYNDQFRHDARHVMGGAFNGVWHFEKSREAEVRYTTYRDYVEPTLYRYEVYLKALEEAPRRKAIGIANTGYMKYREGDFIEIDDVTYIVVESHGIRNTDFYEVGYDALTPVEQLMSEFCA